MSRSAVLSAPRLPALAPRRSAARRAPAPRRAVLSRAAAAPQWSTDKTLYGEEKVDLKPDERLQCVFPPLPPFITARVLSASRSRASPSPPPPPPPPLPRVPRLDRAPFRG